MRRRGRKTIRREMREAKRAMREYRTVIGPKVIDGLIQATKDHIKGPPKERETK